MDRELEENIRAEIADITEIPFRDRSEEALQRLNALEAELRRRYPERHDKTSKLTRRVHIKLDDARSGVSTAAQWVQRLKNENLLQPSHDLNHLLRTSALPLWPTSTAESFPQVGDGETLKCQPFVTARLRELRDCQWSGRMSKHRRGLAGINTFVRLGLSDTTVDVEFTSTAVDSHNNVSFETRKPDVVCYWGDEVGPMSITLLGDVKGCTSATNDFPDEEIGHILDMATTLMRKQQFHRQKLFCFLTDGLRYQFFRLTRQRRSHLLCVFRGICAGERMIFFGLLTVSAETLGFNSIDVPGHKIGRGLGCGAFSDVYACHRIDNAYATNARRNEDELVMKVFGSGETSLVETEVAALRALCASAASAHVPRFLDCISTPTLHVLIPIGVSILPCPYDVHVTPTMRIDLLRTVRATHNMGWIHRDIKPDNIYVDHMNYSRIVLKNWKCTVPAGELCAFAGTRCFADRPHVGEHHTPCAAMDLRALVRTLFCVSKQRLPWVADDRWENVEAFWRSIENTYPSFARAMQLASDSDYDALEETLNVLW